MQRAALLAGLFFAVLTATALAAEKIPGIGPVSEVVKVKGDFQFTEGPASDGRGNLYFTDIPANRIYVLDASGKVSTFLEPSNHCNGLMLNKQGKLFACEMDGRLVSIDVPTKGGGATARDRAQDGSLLHTEPWMLRDKGVTLRVEDVGHLHDRPTHDCGGLRRRRDRGRTTGAGTCSCSSGCCRSRSPPRTPAAVTTPRTRASTARENARACATSCSR